MEKNKSKKPKIIEMRYPAPYSQSWANPEHTKQDTTRMKKSTSQGIRTKPEPSTIKKIYQTPRKKPDENEKNIKEEKTLNKSEKKKTLQDIHIKKKPLRKGQHSENALPERSIDKRLSTSETTHVDIKPISKPSPKIVSRAVSPKRYAKRKLL